MINNFVGDRPFWGSGGVCWWGGCKIFFMDFWVN